MTRNTKLKVTLLTGRTIEQGVGKEQGKTSKDYVDSVSVCYIDPEDLKKLGMKEKSNVLVSTDFGSVVVKLLKSRRKPHPGLAFIPYGPWANAVIGPATDSVGMPSMKGIQAEIEPALDMPFLGFSELLEKQFGKEPYGCH